MKKPFIKRKVVKTRKPHECGVCIDEIKKGDLAINEQVYKPYSGYTSTYFHTTEKCVISYFDIVQPNGDKINEILSKIPHFDYSKLPQHISSMIKHRGKP